MNVRSFARTAAVLLATSAVVSGCSGGASGAPTDATSEDFCETSFMLISIEDGKSANDWAKKATEVGTPSSISDKEREGFEYVVDLAADIDPDATQSEVEEIAGDDAKAEAFGSYVASECEDVMAKLMGDMMTELRGSMEGTTPEVEVAE